MLFSCQSYPALLFARGIDTNVRASAYASMHLRGLSLRDNFHVEPALALTTTLRHQVTTSLHYHVTMSQRRSVKLKDKCVLTKPLFMETWAFVDFFWGGSRLPNRRMQ
jgi:hypothetical protein